MRVKLLIIITVTLFLFSCDSTSPFYAYAKIELSAETIKTNGEEIVLNVSISGTGNSYFLQGIFTEPGETNYFGYTQNHHGDWYLADATPTKDYITSNFFQTKPVGDQWSGELKIKNDPKNKNYKGPGQYELKVRRYTGESNSHTGDEVVLMINLSFQTPTPTSTPTSTSTPVPTPTPTPTSAPSKIDAPTSTYNPTPTISKKVLATKTTLTTPTDSLQASSSDLVLSQSISTPSSAASSFNPTIQPLPQSKKSHFPSIFIAAGVLLSLTSLFLWGRRQLRIFRPE